MRTCNISEIVNGLREIGDDHFTCQNIHEYLQANPVDVDSITKYFFFRPDFYTRNLIYKDDRFEMMTICWDIGQVSRIHNHWDQKCWMTVPVGKLWGQNFAVESMDRETGHCKIRPTDSYELSNSNAATVELEEPIHQVGNADEWNERAVSLHVYSKPYDKCLSYCRDTDTFKEVSLCYTSIDGKLV